MKKKKEIKRGQKIIAQKPATATASFDQAALASPGEEAAVGSRGRGGMRK
jgi:hypothetical protein